MFEHLDDLEPIEPPAGAREAVRRRVTQRARRRRHNRLALAGAAVIVLAAAVGVPLGTGAFTSSRGTRIVTTDHGAGPTAGPGTSSSQRQTPTAPTTVPAATNPATASTTRPDLSPGPSDVTGFHAMISVQSVAMSASGRAWALGYGERDHWVLDTSDDGGRTWQRVPLPTLLFDAPTSALLRVRVTSDGQPWIYASTIPGPLFTTADLGRHWTASRNGPQFVADLKIGGTSLWAITLCKDVADPPQGAGPSNCPAKVVISGDDGRTWTTPTAQPSLGTGMSQSADSTQGMPRLTAFDRDHAWVVSYAAKSEPSQAGDSSTRYGEITVERTTDGGRSWQVSRVFGTGSDRLGCGSALSLDTESARDPWLLCMQLAGAGQAARAILRSHDGGATWTVVHPEYPRPVPPGYDEGYPSDIVAMGNMRALLAGGRMPFERTVDGGVTWQQAALPGNPWEGGFNHGVVCHEETCLAFGAAAPGGPGAKPSVWRTTDGGGTWSTPVSLP